MNLKDKVIVITGSTRGFGYIIAQEMLKHGARVVVSGRSQTAIESALNGLQAQGRVRGEICDITSEDQVYALAESIIQNEGQIDIWINNAGYSSAAGRLVDMNPQEGLEMFQANSLGTMYGTQAAYKHGAKMLVNMYGAGSNGKASSPMGLYATTKAWVTSFTRTLAKEMADDGMQIVGFNPGMMLTDMLTRPTAVGEAGAEMMKNYDFVLRFLARTPEESAADLARVISLTKKPFTEYRVIKAWTPLFGLLRVFWENITKTGKTPEFEVEMKERYEK
jgi:glucose 1-dehydrogenase